MPSRATNGRYAPETSAADGRAAMPADVYCVQRV